MSGRAGWLRIYLADIRPLYQEPVQRQIYAKLDAERRRRADACRLPKARAESLAAGFLARHALQDCGYAGWQVCYGETGQPQVYRECAAKQAAPYISLSHSGDYAACAVSDRPVGVDIQKLQPIRIAMLRRFFTEEEACAFRERHGLEKCATEPERHSHPAGARKEESAAFLPEEAAHEFLRLWTVKESCMKLAGTGLALGLSNVAADLERKEAWMKLPEGIITSGDGQKIWERIPCRITCAIREQKAPAGYFLTACTAGTQVLQESLFWVDLKQ